MKILLLVGFLLSQVVYKDDKENEIHPKDLVKYGTFFIEFPQYRLKLESVVYDKGGVKFRKGYCYYSASIENKESYGSFNVCDGVKGRIVVNGVTVEYISEGDAYTIMSTETKEDITQGIKKEAKDEVKEVNSTTKDEVKEVNNTTKDEGKDIKRDEVEIKVKNNHVVITIDENIKVKEIELSKDEGDPNKLEEDKKSDLQEDYTPVYVKIFFINDKDRVEDLRERVDSDTQEIFEEASKIIRKVVWRKFKIYLQYMGSLNIVEGAFYEGFYRRNIQFIPVEKLMNNDMKIEKLEYLRHFFRKKEDELLKKSNLVVLLTSRDLDDVEGLSYIGGSSSKRDGFSTINIQEKDSVFYKGKVLAHEILHSLGAEHSTLSDSLMNESFSPIHREKELSIEVELEEFNLEKFKREDTCGSGYLDGTKECDSGLLGGSECCTGKCKLRKGKECDDRNGGCCKGCRLVGKDTPCGDPTGNYFFKDCQRQGRCSGVSPQCRPILLEDGRGCLQGGVCQKGVCQTPSLWCNRVNRRYEKGCEDATRLMCLDEKNVCGVVLDSHYKPFLLSQ